MHPPRPPQIVHSLAPQRPSARDHAITSFPCIASSCSPRGLPLPPSPPIDASYKGCRPPRGVLPRSSPLWRCSSLRATRGASPSPPTRACSPPYSGPSAVGTHGVHNVPFLTVTPLVTRSRVHIQNPRHTIPVTESHPLRVRAQMVTHIPPRRAKQRPSLLSARTPSPLPSRTCKPSSPDHSSPSTPTP